MPYVLVAVSALGVLGVPGSTANATVGRLAVAAQESTGLDLGWELPDLPERFAREADAALEALAGADDESAVPRLEDLADRALALGLDGEELRVVSALRSHAEEQGSRSLELDARLGRLLLDAGRAAEAIDVLNRFRSLELDAVDPADRAWILFGRFDLDVAEHRQGRRDGAVEREMELLRALIQERGADDLLVLRARSKLAWAVLRSGDVAGAESRLRGLLADFERVGLGDHFFADKTRTNVASCLLLQGRVEPARRLFREVHARWERRLAPDHNNLYAVRINLAAVAHQSGHYLDSAEAYEKLLPELDAREPGSRRSALARANLGAARVALGDYGGALEVLEEARTSLERLAVGAPERVAFTQNLAAARLGLGDRDGARELAELTLTALSRAERVNALDRLAMEHFLAGVLMAAGDVEGAEERFTQVAEERSRVLPEGHLDLVRSRRRLCAIDLRRGDLDKARRLSTALLDELEARLDAEHPEVLSTRLLRARIAAAAGDLDEARDDSARVASLRAERLGPGHPSVLVARELEVDVRLALAETEAAGAVQRQLAQGVSERMDAAIAWSAREARAVASELSPLAERLLAKSTGDVGDAGPARAELFALLETLRVLGTGGLRVPDGDPELRGRLLRARRRVAGLLFGAEEGPAWREAWAQANLERDRLERELRAARAGEAYRVTAAEVAATLSADAAVVTYQRLRGGSDETVVAWVLSSGDASSPQLVDLGPRATIQEAVADWRAALGKSVTRGVASTSPPGEPECGRRLRTLVWDPVRAALPEDVTRVFTCVDDALHLVPLDALPLEATEDVERVGDHLLVLPQTSLAALTRRGPFEAGEGLLLVADPDFDASREEGLARVTPRVPTGAPRGRRFPDWSALVGTALEAKAIAALHESAFDARASIESLEGEAVTREALERMAPGRRFVHVATHGWFEPEAVMPPWAEPIDASAPSANGVDTSVTVGFGEGLAGHSVRGLAPWTLSGLCLAGANRANTAADRTRGLLTAEELAGFDLASCELAVLSACETNVGIVRAGEGILSLQSALVAAGARRALTSLWTVDDLVTKDLMRRFYDGLWRRGESPGTALWRAKAAVRRDYADPRFWAGWVLVGASE